MPENVRVASRAFAHTVAASVNSTDAYAPVAAVVVDAAPYASLAYTIAVATNAIKWTVYGANKSDYSDEQVVQVEGTVAANATGAYVVAQAPYRYYRIKIKASVAGSQGAVVATVMLKA
jgi:hypothetical protein